MNPTEPKGPLPTGEMFCAYFDFYRDTIEAKLRSVRPEQLREPRLPSAWTPLELLNHLVHMERRWFVWAFSGEPVPEPFGDRVDGDSRGAWVVPDDATLDDLLEEFHAGGRRTRAIVAGARLDEVAPPGPRFRSFPPQTLEWICFHVLQEYARHAGHLDVVVELAGGAQGE